MRHFLSCLLLSVFPLLTASCARQSHEMDVGLSQFVYIRPQLEQLATVSRSKASFRSRNDEGRERPPAFQRKLEVALEFVDGALRHKPSEMDNGAEQILIQIQSHLRQLSEQNPQGPSPELERTMEVLLEESKSLPNASTP